MASRTSDARPRRHDPDICDHCQAARSSTTPIDKPPGWTADAVFYQIFPDRFARSGNTTQPAGLESWDSPPTIHGYKGGDLDGIRGKLDWLTDLGINAIYLNPIFASASNHRYHTHDYFKVDPLLGGDAAFDRLLSACHRRDTRVVLDGVFNHTGRGFLPFNDLLESGPASPWRDWFIVHDWPLNGYAPGEQPRYEAWRGMPALPKLNTDNPEVRSYLMSVCEYWLDRGVDGWRLDVPTEIKTDGFWEEFRSRARAINPDAYLVGELWHDATAWVADGTRFDGAMNYRFTEAAVAYAVGSRVDQEVVEPIPYTVTPPVTGSGYAARITGLLGSYPEAANLANLNLLGSHDTPRIKTVAGGDRRSVLLATVLLLTFPGPPSIYYGDEVGMLGEPDPGCRGSFPWHDEPSWDEALLRTTRKLVALRHQHGELRSPHYETLWPRPGAESAMHVFRRGRAPGIIVAVNAGDDTAAAAVDVQRHQLLWATEPVEVGTLALPARAAALWREAA